MARRRSGPDRHPGRAHRGGPAAPAAGVPVRAGRHQRRELRHRGDGHAVRAGVGGERPDVPDPAGNADHRHGDREGGAGLARPGRVHAAAAPVVDRRADEPVHLDVDRGDAGRRAAGVPPGPARQRPDRRAGRRDRAAGAALHPLLGVPERVPGLRAHRRPRLRLGVPGPDRRGAVAAADRGRGQRVPAVRVVAVRGVLRRLPGEDRHSLAAGPPARPSRRGGGPGAPGAQPGGGHHGRRLLGDGQPGAMGGGAGRQPARARARPRRPHPPAPAAAVGMDRRAGRTGSRRARPSASGGGRNTGTGRDRPGRPRRGPGPDPHRAGQPGTGQPGTGQPSTGRLNTGGRSSRRGSRATHLPDQRRSGHRAAARPAGRAVARLRLHGPAHGTRPAHDRGRRGAGAARGPPDRRASPAST